MAGIINKVLGSAAKKLAQGPADGGNNPDDVYSMASSGAGTSPTGKSGMGAITWDPAARARAREVLDAQAAKTMPATSSQQPGAHTLAQPDYAGPAAATPEMLARMRAGQQRQDMRAKEEYLNSPQAMQEYLAKNAAPKLEKGPVTNPVQAAALAALAERQRVVDGSMTPEEAAGYEKVKGDAYIGSNPTQFLQMQEQWKGQGLDSQFDFSKYGDYLKGLAESARQAGVSSTDPAQSEQYAALQQKAAEQIKSGSPFVSKKPMAMPKQAPVSASAAGALGGRRAGIIRERMKSFSPTVNENLKIRG